MRMYSHRNLKRLAALYLFCEDGPYTSILGNTALVNAYSLAGFLRTVLQNENAISAIRKFF